MCGVCCVCAVCCAVLCCAVLCSLHGADDDLRSYFRVRRSKIRGVLRSSGSKNEGWRNCSKIGRRFFEVGVRRIISSSSKNSLSSILPLRRSKKPPFYDLRSRRSWNSHLQSSIFGPKIRSKNPSSSIFGSEEWVEDRIESRERSVTYVKMKRFSEDREVLRFSGPEERIFGRIYNLDISRAGRGGAALGEAAGR